MQSFSTPIIQPIHIAKFNKGKLYKISSNLNKLSIKKRVQSYSQIQQLNLKPINNSSFQSRHGRGLFSYRRWYEASINFSPVFYSNNIPMQIQQQNKIKKLFENDSMIRKSSTSQSSKFRRNLKKLRQKVQQKIQKAMEPRPFTQESNGIKCNSISGWRKKRLTQEKCKFIVTSKI